MKKITAIKSQRRNLERVSVFLDGEFEFGIARVLVGSLRVGQMLAEDQIAALRADDELESAYLKAINFLSYRSRSSAEIRKNLRKHEISELCIEPTIERLEKLGFVNDKEFAETWVENRNTFRPRGKRALTYELRQKGITNKVIESTLEEMVNEEELVYRAGIKKAKKLARRNLEWQDFRKKLAAFLARRGFNYGVISPVLSQLWDEVREEEE
ncbi:MAG: RecX family transcriptional regulator [Anaerolineae bacterium]|jgi:regulatory protein|nr:RecX family transcriptional regulator [Anaerolineae bacterium]MBT7073353.1 RecX family transcriptional regulator [Anaerolineae bacterium]MBT7782355.1 RecX family transcriptional regulator [Anaerolineae bacterium]